MNRRGFLKRLIGGAVGAVLAGALEAGLGPMLDASTPARSPFAPLPIPPSVLQFAVLSVNEARDPIWKMDLQRYAVLLDLEDGRIFNATNGKAD